MKLCPEPAGTLAFTPSSLHVEIRLRLANRKAIDVPLAAGAGGIGQRAPRYAPSAGAVNVTRESVPMSRSLASSLRV